MSRIQACIARRESDGDLTAHNPAGYWGRYQMSDRAWRLTTGLPGHASQYPATVQDTAFLRLFHNGRGRHQWSTYPACRAIYGGPA